MPKSCFVIMPFGKDKEREEFYTSVYESIIFQAATKCGYEVNRVDTDPSNIGSITKNIVKGLVYSDIVIADLSEGNANVFYELGIRHAFHKCSTILIIQEEYTIPFDLKQHVAVFYSTDIRGIQAAIHGISKAIERSEKAKESDADNPVHEHIPALSFISSAENEEMLKRQIEKLSDDVKNYKIIADKYGFVLEQEIEEDEDIERSLEEADDLVNTGGVSALNELRATVSEGDTNKFQLLLKVILKGKLLSEQNYIDISDMCDKMHLIPHRIIVLNEGHKLFPKSYKIAGLLADAYSDHPQPQPKQKGREFIENYMNIEYEDNLPVASKLTPSDDTLLAGLFNIYNQQDDWQSIISFCNSATKYGLDGSIITRNKARALVEIGDYNTAETEILATLEENPDDDRLQTTLSSLYRRTGEYEKALIAQERALLIDPHDATNYLNLTIEILNRGFVRNDEGDIIGPIDRKRRLAECFAIMNYALQLDSSPARRFQLAEILNRRNARKEAEEVMSTGHISSNTKSMEMEYLSKSINEVSLC